MNPRARWSSAVAMVLVALVAASPAGAAPTRAQTKNMHTMGSSVHLASFFHPDTAPPEINSDIAFWGDLAFHGNYDGFRIVDVSAPGNPKLVSHTRCDGNQGDIVVWEDVLVRSWNSPAPSGKLCDGQPVDTGFEGVHVFDISNPADPVLLTAVETECGSHTATGVPDLENDRLIVYNNVSSGCDWIDVIEVPLSNPQNASLLRMEPLAGPFTSGVSPGCHDMGVILGNANLAACASADATNVFDIGANAMPGGSLEDPELLYTISEPGVGDLTQGSGRWHSAAFTWDGKVLVLGWEPGGGAAPRCTATGTVLPGGVVQTITHKTLFFYDTATGAKVGQWTLGRDQTVEENCTIHNYNVIPVRSGRYVLAQGSYQSGTSIIDFTNLAAPVEVAYTDPAPVVPTDLAGAWSSYWYNNFVYESSISEGLNVFRASDRATAGAMRLGHLNPQTQEFTL